MKTQDFTITITAKADVTDKAVECITRRRF